MTPLELVQAIREAARGGVLTTQGQALSFDTNLLDRIKAASTLEGAKQIALDAGFSKADITASTSSVFAPTTRLGTKEREAPTEADRAFATEQKAVMRERAVTVYSNDPSSYPGVIFDQDREEFVRDTGEVDEDGQTIFEVIDVNEEDFEDQVLSFEPTGETFSVIDADEYTSFVSPIPPAPLENKRTYLGFDQTLPPGFEPGLGVDPSDQERVDALARIERTRRSQFQDYLSGGRNRIAVDDLNVFTDDGTLEFRYFEGEQWSFSLKGANYIRDLQGRMERGALLPPGSYVPGLWDKATVTAMQNLMSESNAKGLTWEMSLSERVTLTTPEILAELYGTGSSSSRVPFTSPTYRAPDHVSLSQAVKQLVRDRLRREPSAREMADLTSQMDGDYRRAYDVEVSALRQEYDATTRAIDTEESQGAGSVRLVDPSARFQQAFESKFKGELSLAEDTDDTIIQTAKIQGAMQRLDSMIGF